MKKPLIAVAALALLVAACSSKATSNTASSPKVPAATISSGAATAPPPSAAGSGTATARATFSGSATSQPTANASTAKPPKSDPTAPPQPGDYVYRNSGKITTSQGSQQPPKELIHHLDPPTTATPGYDQREVDRTPDGETQAEITYGYPGDRVTLKKAGQQGASCELQPPLTILPLPLKVGARWSDVSSCEAGQFKANFHVEGQVLRTENQTVGGTTVKTFVVKTTVEVTSTVFNQTQEATTWVSPQYRLITRSVTHTVTQFGNEKSTADITSVLQNLKPR